jgi:hypothetical protein
VITAGNAVAISHGMTKHLSTVLVLSLAVMGCAGGSPDGTDDGSPSDDGSSDDSVADDDSSGDDSGDDSAGDDSTPGSGMELGAFLTALGHQECDDAFTCMSTWPTAENGPFAEAWGASATECYSGAAEYYDESAISAAVASGKLTYDGDAAEECIAGIPAPVCTSYWTSDSWPDSCYDALYGDTADGGTCTTDFECSGDTSYCNETGVCAADTGQ